MKIEEQVCTLIQGKRLVELGVSSHDSTFSHCHYSPDPTEQHDGYSLIIYKDENTMESVYSEYIAPAFTVAELGVMLSVWIDQKKPAEIVPEFIRTKYGEDVSNIYNPSMCADLLIWCLENDKLTPFDCNTALNK